MAINRIIYGDEGANEFYGFDWMRGDLLPKETQVEILWRPGRDGERLRDMGVRARLSKIVTRLFVDDVADHLTLVESYLGLINGTPYEIKQHGESHGYFKIIRVTPREPIAATSAVGHVGGGTPSVLSTVEWEVISTDAPEE